MRLYFTLYDNFFVILYKTFFDNSETNYKRLFEIWKTRLFCKSRIKLNRFRTKCFCVKFILVTYVQEWVINLNFTFANESEREKERERDGYSFIRFFKPFIKLLINVLLKARDIRAHFKNDWSLQFQFTFKKSPCRNIKIAFLLGHQLKCWMYYSN